MVAARPLRDVFTELTGADGGHATSPAEVLAASGHADLPEDLVAEAVVSFADTAPVEVAEHLAPYVQAHSPVPLVAEDAAAAAAGTDAEPGGWLDALTAAPAMGLASHGELDPAGLDDYDTDGYTTDGRGAEGYGTEGYGTEPAHLADPAAHPLAFGHGTGPGAEPAGLDDLASDQADAGQPGYADPRLSTVDPLDLDLTAPEVAAHDLAGFDPAGADPAGHVADGPDAAGHDGSAANLPDA
ncbi:MAG TPA: hypothetical protein VF163_08020 [Micromonosporaceae bacterium]